MTKQEKDQVIALQQTGYGSLRVAQQLGLPINTVKSFFRRHPFSKETTLCEACGKEFIQPPHKKKQRFCCEDCRRAWWKKHPECITRKTTFSRVCDVCGQPFQSPRPTARFCCRACYRKSFRKESL